MLDLEGFGKAAEALAALGRFPSTTSAAASGSRTGQEWAPSIADYAEATVRALHDHLDPEASLIVEPEPLGGRSLDRHAVRGHHRQAGRLTHVAVNGGMGDNLEPMLYGQRFAPFVLDEDRPPRPSSSSATTASGDVLEREVLSTPRVGDHIVMPVTGAYCYSLSNNYNGVAARPSFCRDGEATLAVRRETFDDLLARNVR